MWIIRSVAHLACYIRGALCMTREPYLRLVMFPLVDIGIGREEAVGIPDREHDALDRLHDPLLLEVHIST